MEFWRTLFSRNHLSGKPTQQVAPILPAPPYVPIAPAPLPIFQTLVFSSTAFTVNAASAGTINNATAGSVIVAVGLPSGLTINSLARTWAWSGIGTATSGSFLLYENVPGSAGNPNISTISYTIAVLGLTTPTFLAYSGSGSTSLIGSYGLTESGVPDPPQFWFAFGGDEAEGDFVEFQIDTANTYNTGNLRTESRVLLWTGTVFEFADPATDVPGDFTIQTALTPSTTYKMRRRIRRDYGDTSIYSDWTPDVTVSVAAAGFTFAWNPANKSTWDSTHQTLSNSNRTWLVTTAAAGANSAIRSTLNITGSGTKVYFEFNIDTWDLGGSGGSVGLATDTYGGAGSPGSLASVGDALANLSQTGWLQDAGADLYVANSYVATPAGIDLLTGHAIGFAVHVNVSDTTLWVLDNGVCGHGDPVAGTGGYTLPFTQLRPVAALNPNNGTNQGITINTLAAATSRAPSTFTPAGA